MKEPEAKILDHDYDGIREFDNPLPRWWLATFYAAIVFAPLYFAYYHIGSGPAPVEELAQDINALKTLDANANKADPGPTEEVLATIYKSPEHRELGHKLFTEKCSSCHAPDGGGLIGPNLTDRYWIHGHGTLLDISKVVAEGVADKGMPPWKFLLKKDEILNVVAYVKSLQGTHPANPKAPQGEESKD